MTTTGAFTHVIDTRQNDGTHRDHDHDQRSRRVAGVSQRTVVGSSIEAICARRDCTPLPLYRIQPAEVLELASASSQNGQRCEPDLLHHDDQVAICVALGIDAL